uniref:Helicase ATP-binding domain-containing protein n=1 Tax=Panagrolaimus sp. ES5 TaxID=591445 RepID=A0AC34F769_9BILA
MVLHQYPSNQEGQYQVICNLPAPELEYGTFKVYRDFKHDLDPFQKHAIRCINVGSCDLLVAVPTSAGKTVVAQQAIDVSLSHGKKTIYTAPIKALSNQKYHEFSKMHMPDNKNVKLSVGLITGDTVLQEESDCLIMTTEILLEKVIGDVAFFDDVQWVIFDEVHYIGDKDRGSVWEQCIILLPETVHFVFLSASIPNAQEFAEWIFSLKKRPCHIVETFTRPVPLRTYLCVTGKNVVQEVIDGGGTVQRDAVISVLEGSDVSSNSGSGVLAIVKDLVHQNNLPCCVFSFSRKNCDNFAKELGQRCDFLDVPLQDVVHEAFKKGFPKENGGYSPAIVHAYELLLKGIVVVMCKFDVVVEDLIKLLASQPEKLQSKFRFSPWDVLNLLNSETMTLNQLFESTFKFFQLGEKRRRVALLTEEIENFLNDGEGKQLHDFKTLLYNLKDNIRRLVLKPENCQILLNRGRVIEICNEDKLFGYGVILDHVKIDNPHHGEVNPYFFQITVLMKSASQSYPLPKKKLQNLHPVKQGEYWYPVIVDLYLDNVFKFYNAFIALESVVENVNRSTSKDSFCRAAKEMLRYLDFRIFQQKNIIEISPYELNDNLLEEDKLSLSFYLKEKAGFDELQEKLNDCKKNLKNFLAKNPGMNIYEKLSVEYKVKQQEIDELLQVLDRPTLELEECKRLLNKVGFINDEEILTIKVNFSFWL